MTKDNLHKILHYEPTTGIFTWAVSRHKVTSGSPAGYLQKGYVTIETGRKSYRAHRLAWFYTYGVWPSDQIDHINGDRADNRICNLREASNAENMQNQRRSHSNNKLGVLGVHKRHNGFRARITVNKKIIQLGFYKTKELAHEAYLKAKRELHTACMI